MKKVKEFIKEHKLEIAGVITCGVSCGIGVYLGYSYYMTKNPALRRSRVKEVFDDATRRYKEFRLFSMYNTADGFYTPTELGKLGEHMIECGVPSDAAFTHFIAIGKPESK